MNFLWSLLFFCAAVRVSHGTEQRELLTLMMPEVGPEGVKVRFMILNIHPEHSLLLCMYIHVMVEYK